MNPTALIRSSRSRRSAIRQFGRHAVLWALAICPAAAAATQVYRTVDANGTVVLSDRPPPPGTPVEVIELHAPNTFLPPAANRPAALGAAPERGEAEEPAAANPYRSLRVIDPPHDAGIRENAGNVVLTVEVDPALRPGHELLVYTNGVLRQRAASPRIQLMQLDRGTHVVELQVIDEAGNTVMTSEPSVFHLQRRSTILQPVQRPSPG